MSDDDTAPSVEDMTEPELVSLTERIMGAIRAWLSDSTAFAVLFWEPPPVGMRPTVRYGGNCTREALAACLLLVGEQLSRPEAP